MSKKRFLWWHQDPDEFKQWKFLNSLDDEGKARFAKQIEDKREKYGNLYFYIPLPKLEDFHRDMNPQKNLYGNNGSGKSYGAAAETGYEWIGYSPFRDIPKPDFGSRLIWIATTDYGIQLDSSQLLLFADVNDTAGARGIGLLPSPEVLEDHGFEIVWEKKNKGILNSVINPWDGSRIVFKSMESKTQSFAGAPLDFGWIDEIIPAEKYDELMARTLRKHGRLMMSFLIEEIEDHYTFNTLYKNYNDDLKKKGTSTTSFYFLAIEDNIFLDQKDIEERKKKFTGDGARWRFTEGGGFPVEPKGQIVYQEYMPEHHVIEGLFQQFNPISTLYRVWDLGFTPSCTMFQIDKYNRKKILVTEVGEDVELREFIDQVEARTNDLFPGCISTHEILPHDAARRPNTAVTRERPTDVFDEKKLFDRSIVYVGVETSISDCNKALGRFIKGEPEIQLDLDYTSNLQNAFTFYTRDDKGIPKRDKKLEHPSDNFKLMITYCNRLNKGTELAEKQKQYERYQERKNPKPREDDSYTTPIHGEYE